MAKFLKGILEKGLLGPDLTSKLGIRIPIATKLILSFLLIIVMTSTVFTVVGIQLIRGRIDSEAREKVRQDLDTAREAYLDKLDQINTAVHSTARSSRVVDAVAASNMEQAAYELMGIRLRAELDILTITDESGNVLFRTGNQNQIGDNIRHNELISAVLSEEGTRIAAITIVEAEELQKESATLAAEAYVKFINSPEARARQENEEIDGMVLGAAAPIINAHHELIGVAYGGVLLDRNFEYINRIKQTVFQNTRYDGKDIGTATIYQDDVGISTTTINDDGSRLIGTRVSEEVYDQVINGGRLWIGRSFIANNGYIAAYEPIKNLNYEIIGILHVGILEQKYLDIQNESTITFLTTTFIVALISMLLSYLISLRISIPIKKLVSASSEVAHGNLDAKVETLSNDELGELAESFNAMASTLKERDRKLREFARIKIMESERLALIGQLSANVAHELNNPLTGIVTYSHLLLERMPNGDSNTKSVQKIITQANRCKEIIRGLLDFSRQRKPDKTSSDVNYVLQECISLVENQAAFHNIQIIKDFDAKLPTAVIDPSQIERVFINMIINAAEAMEGGGRLTISTDTNPSKQFVRIRFSDTGYGIAEENMEKIFDPFFTTKEVGHGTGLGLAISYGIIKEHGGAVRVESRVNKGTTFNIRLPVAGNGLGQSTNGQQA